MNSCQKSIAHQMRRTFRHPFFFAQTRHLSARETGSAARPHKSAPKGKEPLP